ncbi:MAG TPA: extracellular solute-binding protein [Candidatus Paceibacterota bacterium]|nr:extracellular solute-binding protein [Candidatus Paceibacterota bacterium]
MNTKAVVISLVVLALIGAGVVFAWVVLLQRAAVVNQPLPAPATPTSTDKIKLTYAVHWEEKYQLDGVYENGQLKSKGLRQYLDEYMQLHPNVEIDVLQIPYSDYASKLQLFHDTDSAPDIYQIYSTWGVEFQHRGVLANPPTDVKDEVKKNYVSTAGVTIANDIWGIPTEVDDYALVYNKDLFKKAGLVDEEGNAKPPTTWAELVADAVKLTKKDEKGNIAQYGFAFTPNNDTFVVGPFLSLLSTNNGKYLSDDYSKCLLSSPEGVETAAATQQLFTKGVTDMNGNVWDFGQGKVAMIVMAPWTEGTLRQSLTSTFDNVVGVAPIPYLKKPASLQYSWFMGVMAKSKHQQEAWDFLRWFAFEPQPDRGTTRYGDLLAQTIGAIPSRRNDIAGNASWLETPFKKVFVDELPNSAPEPNVLQSARLSSIVMAEVQSTWTQTATPAQAMTSACAQIDDILKSYYPVSP